MLAPMSPISDFGTFTQLRNEMNRLFERFVEGTPLPLAYDTDYPGINLWEEGDTAYIEAEMPGLSMDEVEVLVTGNELTISGERKITAPENAAYYRRERATGRFSRILALPWEIEAKLRDGVLTVTLPKCESYKPKKVNVLPA
jgi:HSP20 family protein